MPRILVTGGGGLVGSAVCERFHAVWYEVVSLDNDLRGQLLSDPEGSVKWNLERLAKKLPHFTNYPIDIRSRRDVETVFADHKFDAVVHCAAQTAHEGKLLEDFQVNMVGTLNVLQGWKKYCPKAPFVYLSTIKVYGSAPNRYFPDLYIKGSRFDLPEGHRYYKGFDETLPLGGEGAASFFSRSKTAADLYVQEFAYQYGLSAICLRPSCITGGFHAGTEAHGMLAYMMKCAVLQRPYTIYGYQGHQVRDQLHVRDLVDAIQLYIEHPKSLKVCNIGGGRQCMCSISEALKLCEEISGNRLIIQNGPGRMGDHAWWVTDSARFQQSYPTWRPRATLEEILIDIYTRGRPRWIP